MPEIRVNPGAVKVINGSRLTQRVFVPGIQALGVDTGKSVEQADKIKQVAVRRPPRAAILHTSVEDFDPLAFLAGLSLANGRDPKRPSAAGRGVKREPPLIRSQLRTMDIPMRMRNQGTRDPCGDLQQGKPDRLTVPVYDLPAVRGPPVNLGGRKGAR
jgi:hypothetical protein